MSDDIQRKIDDIIALGKARGFITYDELNAALPPDAVTSEQIEEAMFRISDLGIDIVESTSSDSKIDREEACLRSIRRMELALAALQHGRTKHACQILETALAELKKFC